MSREELLHSIQPGMQLDKFFFLRVYGYDITTPGFAENALKRLEILGYSKARNYYTGVVLEEEREHQKALKLGAEWLSKEIEKYERKGVMERAAGIRKPKYQFAGFPEDW